MSDALRTLREYVDNPGNWSALDGRRRHILGLIDALLPCDGGCRYGDGPMEDCSQHGRPVAEVWEIVAKVQAENAALREAAHVGVELDNHHNAAICPYCRPTIPTPEVRADQVEELLRRTIRLAQQTPGATLDGSLALLRAATDVLLLVGGV